jgi:hypothetical protein
MPVGALPAGIFVSGKNGSRKSRNPGDSRDGLASKTADFRHFSRMSRKSVVNGIISEICHIRPLIGPPNRF